jgi:poly-beta-1,6 N-acetyl-D-glucosamine synthase
MNWLSVIYLIYMFIAIYFFSLFLFIYLINRNKFFVCPKAKKQYSMSVVVPCYNKGEHIGETIQSLVNSDYKGLKKIIIVDDCSTDNSFEVIKRFAKKYSKVMAVQTPKNTGNAAGAKNYGLGFVKTELICCIDADSYIKENALRNMVGYFNNPQIGSVTGRILVKNNKNLLERLQAIEYAMIIFTRKLLEFIEGIWVTPGALSVYRTEALKEVGGFDTENITEDVEITWKLIKAGYRIKVAVNAITYTSVPNTRKGWWRQRIRWDIGGVQTLLKYKKQVFKKSPLGYFIIPLFAISMFLGLLGLSIFLYLWVKRLILVNLYTSYSVASDMALLTANNLYVNVTTLNFFGAIVLIQGLFLTLFGLSKINPGVRKSFINLAAYFFAYLTIHPVILAVSIYKMIRKDIKW